MEKIKLILQKNKTKRLFGFLFLLAILIVIVVSLIFPTPKNRLLKNDVTNKKTGWSLTYNGVSKPITLPYKDHIPPGTSYRITTILDDLPEDGRHILLRSSMQDFKVYLDGALIQTHSKPTDGSFDNIDASMWVLVDIPEDSVDKTLMIDISSDIESFSGVVNEIKFGHESELLMDILVNSMVAIVCFIMLFSSGFVIVVLSFFFQEETDNRIMNLGLIFITTSIWIVSEGRLLQFINSSRWFVGSASYLVIPLIAALIAQYLRDAVFINVKHKLLMGLYAVVYLVLLILILALQIIFKVPFITSTKWFMILIIGTVLHTSYIMIDEVKKLNNKNAVRHIKYIAVLFVAVIIEAILFYLERYEFTSVFLQLGLLIFLGLLAYDTLLYFKEGFMLAKENELLEKLVYLDRLTGGKNRTAYEKALEELLKLPNKKFRLVILDLNDLKYINDNYGHQQGDEALKSMYLALKAAFIDVGECYRLGGDEMVVLMEDTQSNLFHQCIDKLIVLLQEQNHIFPLRVAIGSDVYDRKIHHNFSVFYHIVDHKMYMDKKKLKDETTY